MEELEGQRQVEIKTLREEKEQLEALILRQTAVISQLEQQLLKVSSNNTVLQNQQQKLLDTVNDLIHTITLGTHRGGSAQQRTTIMTHLKIQQSYYKCTAKSIS